jgi:hypothetical protein
MWDLSRRWAVAVGPVGGRVGAKTAPLAFTEGDIRPALLGATRTEQVETEHLIGDLGCRSVLRD